MEREKSIPEGNNCEQFPDPHHFLLLLYNVLYGLFFRQGSGEGRGVLMATQQERRRDMNKDLGHRRQHIHPAKTKLSSLCFAKLKEEKKKRKKDRKKAGSWGEGNGLARRQREQLCYAGLPCLHQARLAERMSRLQTPAARVAACRCVPLTSGRHKRLSFPSQCQANLMG